MCKLQSHPLFWNNKLQVETAGDCYIAAGGLTRLDADGFTCIDPAPNPVEAALRVLSFGKVGPDSWVPT